MRQIAASRQPGRKKYAAKPPQNFRLKAALPREVNDKFAITVWSLHDHAVKPQRCIKIGMSEKISLFRTLLAIDFCVKLYVVYTKSDAWPIRSNKTRLDCNAELIDFAELIILNLIDNIAESYQYKCQCFCFVKN